ncbi:hypothetical protein LEP1GSC047_2230 [Leptospira inadai serovar Lyme str. 10]|uniref:Uncharacterized protein n=1 Tax=Leptospira inadai serovar Lyme str. 10 TaxID=1049790 RepID=V6HEE7_9LEPT|nr:hypothetical protein LEP1GSC047_2230 [Leptospira inadai serovar Lyme str. 10]
MEKKIPLPAAGSKTRNGELTSNFDFAPEVHSTIILAKGGGVKN